MFKKLMLVVVMLAALVIPTTATASAAPPCRGTWTIGIGGLGDNTSSVFPTVDQRVGYNSFDTRSGVNELNRLITDHRRACGGDHIKAIGHSGGAAALHVWASENGQRFGNINIVLLSDPKRPAGPGGPGFAATDLWWAGYPLAGADANYGGIPTITVCDHRDHICNSRASWNGYLFQNAHGNYNFDVNHWGNWGNGVVWY